MARQRVAGIPVFASEPVIEALARLNRKDDEGAAVRYDGDTITLSELETILAVESISGDFDDRDDWLNLAFAVAHEFHGHEDEEAAHDLFREWAARSSKFDEDETDRILATGHGDNREERITMGTYVKRLRDWHSSPARLKRLFKETDAEKEARLESDRERERLARKARRQRELFDAGRKLSDDDAEGEEGEEGGDESWTQYIKHSKQGEADPSAVNVMLFVQHDALMKKHLRKETLSGKIVWYFPNGVVPTALRDIRPRPGERFVDYESKHHITIRKMMTYPPMSMRKDAPKSMIDDAVDLATDDSERQVSIVHTLLFREKWDGERRIERFFIDYLGAEDTRANREAAKFFFCSAVTRALMPGAQVDNMVVLQGEQGGGKDRVFRVLLDHIGATGASPTHSPYSLLMESKVDLLSPRDFIPQTRGKVLVHLSELASLRGRASEQIKHFITLRADEGRLSYARNSSVIPRSWILLGSTNDQFFLSDTTGNRRFLVVRCIKPPAGSDGVPKFNKRFTHLVKERWQLWAEAKHYVDAEAKRLGHAVGEWAVDPSVWEEMEAAQQDAVIVTPESVIAEDIAQKLDAVRDYEDVAIRKVAAKDRERPAICNQITYAEIAELIGMSDEEFRRSGVRQIAGACKYPALREWERIGKAVRHRGAVAKVLRRRGTNGEPTLINPDAEDSSPDETRTVVHLDDERDKRRSIL